MRALNLYSKILLSFLALLLLSQVLMVGTFLLFSGPLPQPPLDSHLRGLANLAQRLAREGLARRLAAGQPREEALRELALELAGLIEAKVWFSAGDRVLAQSFAGPTPDRPLVPPPAPPPPPPGGFALFPRPPHEMLITIPLESPALDQATLCLLPLHPPEPPPPPPHLFPRLAFIGLVVALLVVPVSRFIARPLKRLRRSALIIADGDLAHRAQVGTRDEVGELALALNTMTDRLQKMILASRELLAHVSHELRSPLARLSVCEQLLRDGLERPETADPRRHLDGIREEVEQMDGLLARILLLSRQDLGPQPQRREVVDLAELLRQQAAKWSALLQYRGMDLELKLPPAALVRGDGEALASAFGNLLDNAARHSLAPGRVRVSLVRRGGSWLASLANPAGPLPPEELEAIFRPFHRAPGAVSPGSGLGLALTRRVLENHGGGVTAAHEAPDLVFRVTLPVA